MSASGTSFSVWTLALLVSAGGLCSSASAQSGRLVDLERWYYTVGEHGILALPGDVQAIGGWVDAIPVTSEAPEVPDEIPADPHGFFRLRATPSFTLTGKSWPVFQAYRLLVDFDVTVDVYDEALDGPLFWDPVQADRSTVPMPRLTEGYFLAAGKFLALKAGIVRSDWGLGILANGGTGGGLDADPPRADANPFGYGRFADRVLRLQVAWFPITPAKGAERAGDPPLTIAVAVDGVVDDDSARWLDGDRAFNFIAAVAGRYEGFAGGLYAVHRTQRHAEGGTTEVTVFDVQARQQLDKGNTRAWVAAEIAMMLGSTTWARSAILDKPFDIFATGGLLRVGIEYTPLFQAVVEGGVASGDDNPFDADLGGFSFDREHRVGLLMFREYLRKTTAVTAYNLADPTYREEPPRGFDRSASGGALQGVMYINPRVALFPFDGFTVLLGYLHAISEGPYTDPYQSGLAGGTSVGPHGAVARSELGHELDLGLDYRFAAGSLLDLALRLEGAWFLPGAVFDDPKTGGQDHVFGAWVHLGAKW